MSAPLLRNISDTARWVATDRADESERADALFHDPLARRLAGERGQQDSGDYHVTPVTRLISRVVRTSRLLIKTY